MRVLMDSMAEAEPNNILIIGPSGYGKTYIAQVMLNWAFRYIRKEETQFINCGESFAFPNKTGIIYDEAHLIDVPESLYGYMDSGKYSIIFTTNYWGDLPEPLKNRCIQIQLSKYNTNDLSKIVIMAFKEEKINITESFALEIAKRSRGTPRVANEISKLIIKGIPVHGLDDVQKILDSYGIFENGFRIFDYEYLDALKNLGGRASLARIMGATNFSKEFIEKEIEPHLINSGKVIITGRGRYAQ